MIKLAFNLIGLYQSTDFSLLRQVSLAPKISEGRGKRDRPSLEDLKEEGEREREREREREERFYSGSWISNNEKTEKCRSSKIARLPDVKKIVFC